LVLKDTARECRVWVVANANDETGGLVLIHKVIPSHFDRTATLSLTTVFSTVTLPQHPL
jgi:hypothetical protein